MNERPAAPHDMENVPCPFCALLCDDLRVSLNGRRVDVAANGCERSRRLFPAADAQASPCVSGRPTSLDAALARAAEILRSARYPAFISAGADVAAVRIMLDLAEGMKGRIDHADGANAIRNLRVLQDAGWISTTLAEVRNRADFLVLAGGGIGRHLPRFHERCFSATTALSGERTREMWIVGGNEAVTGNPRPARHLIADNSRLGEIFSAMMALLAGRKLEAHSIAGIATADLAQLVHRMKGAQYGVLAWSAADLDFPHAELAVQAMCELVCALNLSTRFAILPVTGPLADGTAAQVTTWRTGIPLRVNFLSGAPGPHAPDRDDRPDAVAYVAPLATAPAPSGYDAPLVVLGHADAASWKADVFIPVATPGIHHAGHYYRTDGVVALRMHKLVEHELPSAADALRRLAGSLKEQA